MAKEISLEPDAPSAVVNQRQSLEFVRILIITILSGVLWRRRVFPEVRYKFRVFDPADPRTSYDAFVNEEGRTSTAELACWPILPRSQDPRTEKLLNLLENGVKEALEKGTLSRLQLSFHSAGEEPPSAENLLESYNLGFAYRDGIGLTELTAETHGSATEKTSFSVSNVKQQVEYINHQLQCLMQITRNNSELLGPGRYRMLLRMKYIGNDNHCPTGFHPDRDSLHLLDDALLDPNMRMITGHHSVLAGASLPRLQPQPVARSASSTSATTSRLKVVAKAALNVTQVDRHQSSPYSEFPQFETQPENVKKIETMGVSRRDSYPPSTQLRDISSAPNSQGSHAAAHGENMLVASTQYSQDVLGLVKQHGRLHSQDVNSQGNSLADVCECGVNLLNAKNDWPKDNMINCELCGGHRHLECYGYLDGNFPETFVCYSCLQFHFPEHQKTLRKAENLCIKRRALNYFLNQGSLVAIKDLTHYIRSTSKKAISILNQLKREKLLVGTDRHKSENTPMFTIVGHETLKFVREKYFNPRTGIEIFMSQPTHSLQDADKNLDEISSGISTSQQRLTSSKHLSGQPHILQLAPNEDDDSTQGIPSPQPADGRNQSIHVPVTPAGKIHENDVSLGTKRKTTPNKDNSPKRVKLVHATPLMLRRVSAAAGSPWFIEHGD